MVIGIIVAGIMATGIMVSAIMVAGMTVTVIIVAGIGDPGFNFGESSSSALVAFWVPPGLV